MAGSIKLFQLFQKFHQTLGIYPTQVNQKHHLIISRRAIFLIGSTQYILSTAGYLVFEAQSMFEYGFGYFMSSTTLNGIIIHILLAWQLENTLKFIETCEGFIEKSK